MRSLELALIAAATLGSLACLAPDATSCVKEFQFLDASGSALQLEPFNLTIADESAAWHSADSDMFGWAVVQFPCRTFHYQLTLPHPRGGESVAQWLLHTPNCHLERGAAQELIQLPPALEVSFVDEEGISVGNFPIDLVGPGGSSKYHVGAGGTLRVLSSQLPEGDYEIRLPRDWEPTNGGKARFLFHGGDTAVAQAIRTPGGWSTRTALGAAWSAQQKLRPNAGVVSFVFESPQDLVLDVSLATYPNDSRAIGAWFGRRWALGGVGTRAQAGAGLTTLSRYPGTYASATAGVTLEVPIGKPLRLELTYRVWMSQRAVFDEIAASFSKEVF